MSINFCSMVILSLLYKKYILVSNRQIAKRRHELLAAIAKLSVDYDFPITIKDHQTYN